MIELLGTEASGLLGAVGLGLDVALKATLVLLVALAVHLATRKRWPLVASAFWNAALAALLLMPLAEAALPHLRVACVPAGPTMQMSALVDQVPFGPPPPLEPSSSAEPSAPERQPLVQVLALAPVSRDSAFDVATLVVGLYLLGVGVFAMRLVRSLAGVRNLRRSSRPVVDLCWQERLNYWRERLGLKPRVALLRSPRPGVPVVLGWFRPTIVLPESLGNDEPLDRIDAVLLHELSHVRRADYAWNLALALVQVIYWPHPLAWCVKGLLRSVREAACDDLCVSWLEDANQYRAALVEVAARLCAPSTGPALGMAMARPSGLEQRLERLRWNTGSTRCQLRLSARLAILGILMLSSVLLGSVQLARATPESSQETAPPKKSKDELPPKEADPTEKPTSPERKTPPPVAEPGSGAPAGFGGPGRSVSIPKTVVTAKLHRGFPVVESLTGSVKAFEPVRILPRVAGVLKSKKVEEGDRVKKGQLLAEIDAPDVEFDFKMKQSGLELAHIEVRKASAVISQIKNEAKMDQADKDRPRRVTMNEAEAGLDAARVRLTIAAAELDRVKALLEATKILAPIDGIVIEAKASITSSTRPDAAEPLFILTPAGKVTVVATMPQNEAGLLDRHDPVVFDSLSRGISTYKGRISRIAWSFTEGGLPLEIELDDPEQRLRQGQSGFVRVTLEVHPRSLWLPWITYSRPDPSNQQVAGNVTFFPTDGSWRAGMSIGRGRNDCLVWKRGQLEKKTVTIGLVNDSGVEILEGLNEDDHVVWDGVFYNAWHETFKDIDFKEEFRDGLQRKRLEGLP